MFGFARALVACMLLWCGFSSVLHGHHPEDHDSCSLCLVAQSPNHVADAPPTAEAAVRWVVVPAQRPQTPDYLPLCYVRARAPPRL